MRSASSIDRDGGPAAAGPAAAGRDRPRAVQRGADRHPRRADLGPLPARGPPAVRRAAPAKAQGTSFVFISHFLEDILDVSDSVTVFRSGRKVETARGRGRQGLADRPDDRRRPRGAGRGLYGRDRAQRPAGPAALEATGLTRRSLRRGRLRREGRRGAGRLRLHGLGPARARPRPLRQAGRRAAAGADRRHPRLLAQHHGAKRAGIAYVPESRRSMLFATEPLYKNMSITVLGRIVHCGCGRTRSAPSASGTSSLRIRPPRSIGSCARSRRQPAEGGARAVADGPAPSADPERADARHGRGCQGRCGEDRPGRARIRGWRWSWSRPSPKPCCRSLTASWS